MPAQQTLPSVWFIADKATGRPSVVNLNVEGSTHPWVLGPFAYSNKADAEAAAVEHPSFLRSLDQELTVVEIPGMGFIQGIMAQFPEVHSDVFVLNEGLLPLHEDAAGWVDRMTETSFWRPLFEDEEDAAWINQVLALVSGQLGVETVRVQPFSPEQRREQCKDLIQEHVKVLVVPLAHQHLADGSLAPDATFWIHTMGMARFNRPELEVRGVPAMFVAAAAASLNGWAAYTIDNEIKPNDTIQTGGQVMPVLMVAKPSTDPFWESRGACLTLTVDRVLYVCGSCAPTGMLH